jgi:hypothetical protein
LNEFTGLVQGLGLWFLMPLSTIFQFFVAVSFIGGPIRFLLPVCRLFYTHWTYMHIFRHIFLSNYGWQRSDIWSQASYRYPISWEAFLDPSDSYFLFAEERGYHKWASSQFILFFPSTIMVINQCFLAPLSVCLSSL